MSHGGANRLIVLEGIDGVGKTTLTNELVHALSATYGISAVRYEDVEEKTTGFNTLKPFIKTSVSPESSFFFYVASAINKSRHIEELLKTKWVVCDRYIFSTFAFHAVRGVDSARLVRVPALPIRWPEHYFLITLDDGMRIERMKKRGWNKGYDLVRKETGNIVERFEQELLKWHPFIIDNAGDIKRTLKSLLTEIMK